MRRSLLVSLLCLALVVPARAGISTDKLMLVRVPVASAAEGQYLAAHFDETHNHGDGYMELLLWPGDLPKLQAAGLLFEILDPDLVATDTTMLAQASDALVELPGPNRSDYRTIEDYEAEMKKLAAKHPKFVRLMRLPEKTIDGNPVLGLEIAADVTARTDGRPYLHVDGLHHAREWPSGEYPMIFAHYLVEGFGRDPQITKLLKNVRVEIVPVVNVDGFDYSRDSYVDTTSRGSYPLELLGIGAYWRKNRRSLTGSTMAGQSPDAYGVDDNRNYGYLWGDDIDGSSGEEIDQTYRGEKPFSEAETQNIQGLILSRQVTGLITNHTYGRYVLRAWGHTDEPAQDEKDLKGLADGMAAAMGSFTSQRGIDLYATTGTTDDWAYAATGSFGFTIEHETSFHPPYAESVGTEWPGVMDAFMIGAEAAADRRYHSVIRGRLVDKAGKPVGGGVYLYKKLRTPLWPGNPTGRASIKESFASSLKVDPSGRFVWHVNPSTRPFVAAEGGKEYFRLAFANPSGFAQRKVYVRRGEVLDLGDVVLKPARFLIAEAGPSDQMMMRRAKMI